MKREEIGNLLPEVAGVLVTVIVTHYNYSYLVRSALLSVALQSHENFECIIVDDCSEPSHVIKLRQIISELADKRFKLVELQKNAGQTEAIFEGLLHSSGEFVAFLDPDDLYEPLFIEKMLKCHLNSCVYAAVAACEMGMFRVGGSILTRSYVNFKQKAIESGDLPKYEASLFDFGFSKYYPPETVGWIWATTSSMMFRRDALEILRRKTYLKGIKDCGDAYCVYGAHMLGGTLFVDETLSWRGIHKDNAVESSAHFSSFQRRQKTTFVDPAAAMKFLAAQSILENGGIEALRADMLMMTLKSHFSLQLLSELVSQNDNFIQMMIENYVGSRGKEVSLDTVPSRKIK